MITSTHSGWYQVSIVPSYIVLEALLYYILLVGYACCSSSM